MGTMRNNFARVFVIVILIVSTSQSLLAEGNENAPERHSLTDALTLDPRSRSSSIHECLFIDPNLPVCDIKWMLNSGKESSKKQNSLLEGNLHRSRRNIDVSMMDVVVYTIEGCIPSRLPFTMPSCEGISLNRIVDIQRLRPFAVKGVTKPPLVFPEFSYPEWLRMMTRLQNHVLSKAQEEKESTLDHSSSMKVDESVRFRTNQLMNASARKETMASIVATTKESSLNNLIPKSSIKSAESMGFPSKASHDYSKVKLFNEGFAKNDNSPTISKVIDISTIPVNRNVYEQAVILDPSNEFDTDDNSRNFISMNVDEEEQKTDNGIESDFLPLEMSLDVFRRRRDVRLPVATEEILGDKSTLGIADVSVNQLEDMENYPKSKTSRMHVAKKHKKKSKGLKFIGQEEISQAESYFIPVNEDSRDKIYGSKATWRKRVPKETTSWKKYRKYVELQPSRRD